LEIRGFKMSHFKVIVAAVFAATTMAAMLPKIEKRCLASGGTLYSGYLLRN
jgi:hypothetical protein